MRLILLFLLISFTSYAQMGDCDQNFVEVLGYAEVELTPDIVYLNIVIDERDSKNKKSTEETESILLNIIRNIGINPKTKLKINNFSSDFHNYLFKGNKVIKAKTYQLKIDSIQKVQPLYLQLEENQISNIYISKTEYSDMENAKMDLKIEAVKKTKNNAIKLAKALGQSIGSAIQIIDSYEIQEQNINHWESALTENSKYRIHQEEIYSPLEMQPIILKTRVKTRFALKE